MIWGVDTEALTTEGGCATSVRPYHRTPRGKENERVRELANLMAIESIDELQTGEGFSLDL